MTARKRKLLTLQLVLFFIACAFIYFTYYYDKNIPQKQSNNLIENSTTSEKDQNEVMDTNKFKDVTYRGLDLNGNRYEIFNEADLKLAQN